MAVRFEDALASLPAEEQAAIQARFEELRAEYDRELARREATIAEAIARNDVIITRNGELLRMADEALASVKRLVGRDADLPATGTFHG